MGQMDLNEEGRKLAAEAVGTFVLIFLGAGSIVVTGGANLVASALAYGLAFALMVAALGHLSGGFFNPAITIGLWATRRVETLEGALYIIAQLVGAVVAALFLVVLLPEVMRDATSLGTPTLNPGIEFLQGVGLEAVATAILVVVVYGAVLDGHDTRTGAFAVGLSATVGFLAIHNLTGAALNPARALGPALVDGTWDDHLVYWIGPIIGAVVGALLYHYLFAEETEGASTAI